MKDITEFEIKKLGLEGLHIIKEYCEENNLRYFLSGGTLLGAVRHGGYIPWDDDIDLIMFRRDYEMLINNFSKECNPEWELLSYETHPGYCFPWVKLCHKNSVIIPSRFSSGLIYGVSIDIFPIDFIDDSSFENAVKQVTELKERYKIIRKIVQPFNNVELGFKNHIKGLIKRFYFNVIGKRFDLVNAYKSIEESMEQNESYYCGYVLDRIYSPEKMIWKTSWIDDNSGSKREMKFEDDKFMVPIDCESVLKTMFGDYMTPPPIEKRVTNHSFSALYKDDAYENI